MTILLIIIVAVAVGVFIQQVRRTGRFNTTYRMLARQLRGQYLPGWLFRLPALRFMYEGAHVLVEPYRRSTLFHISWPDDQLVARLEPLSVSAQLARMLGRRDLCVGNPDFDRQFQITTNDAEATREFFSPGVQLAVLQLSRLCGGRRLAMTIEGGILCLRLYAEISTMRELQQMVAAGTELFDQAMLVRRDGIEILLEPALVPSGPPVCKICGDAIVSHVVYCRRCQTPHHADCWQYYGACSVYGCGETRFQSRAESRAG